MIGVRRRYFVEHDIGFEKKLVARVAVSISRPVHNLSGQKGKL